MFRLYQLLLIIPIILFFAGCGGSTTVKKDRTKTDSSRTTVLVNSIDSSTMSNQEKIAYAEMLFNSSLSKTGTDRNTLLSNALYLCSEVLLSEQLTAQDKEHTLQSTQKIISQLDRAALNDEQSNQLLLTMASVELANYQSTQALQLLNQEFNSDLADQWSLYHKLKAMSYFQQGYKVDAIKELIFRHAFILADKLENQTLIWKYLSTLSPQQLAHSEISSAIGLSENERIYFGWLDLADIFRHTNDPQSINYATNFWLQNYPHHQADRSFINQIIRIRQESIINISQIAVLLPMDGKLAKPAKAIQDGIAASHYKSPLADNVRLRFYNTNNKMIEDVYQYAINNGADFVIGPLKKSNLQTLLQSNIVSTPMLALNSIETSSSSGQQPGALSQQLFQFGLSPEAEARIVAHKARQDGHRYAAIIAPDSHWGKRMTDAFAQFWQQSGGTVVAAQTYPSQEHDFSAAIKSILNLEQSEARKNQLSQTIGRKLEFTPRRRQDIDMLFMAAFPRQAKQIPLQIIYHHGETIPVYATSHIIENYYDSRKNIDMDGVIFSDMPFLLGLAPDDAASLQNSYQSPLYQRLFAMGVDSYQVAPYVNYLADNPSESVSGDTGQLSINFNGHIVRSLPWASFSQGKVKLEQKQQPQQDLNTRTGSNDHATLH